VLLEKFRLVVLWAIWGTVLLERFRLVVRLVAVNQIGRGAWTVWTTWGTVLLEKFRLVVRLCQAAALGVLTEWASLFLRRRILFLWGWNLFLWRRILHMWRLILLCWRYERWRLATGCWRLIPLYWRHDPRRLATWCYRPSARIGALLEHVRRVIRAFTAGGPSHTVLFFLRLFLGIFRWQICWSFVLVFLGSCRLPFLLLPFVLYYILHCCVRVMLPFFLFFLQGRHRLFLRLLLGIVHTREVWMHAAWHWLLIAWPCLRLD
jgi:hypothetical protein